MTAAPYLSALRAAACDLISTLEGLADASPADPISLHLVCDVLPRELAEALDEQTAELLAAVNDSRALEYPSHVEHVYQLALQAVDVLLQHTDRDAWVRLHTGNVVGDIDVTAVLANWASIEPRLKFLRREDWERLRTEVEREVRLASSQGEWARMTIKDLTTKLGVTDNTIRKYLRDGTIRGAKIGNTNYWRVSFEDVAELMRGRESP